MKLLTLFEATKKGKYKADQVYNLYMPNGGEDGVLVGWRGDWPEDHFIEFRGLPYSQWTHGGDDFQRVHDRLAGMRATVLHHNSVVNVLPNMPEHGDIARAIDGGELPEWDKDRAFNEDVYHATTRDVDEFRPLSHFGTQKAAADRAKHLTKHDAGNIEGLRTYRAQLDLKNPVYLHDFGQGHDTATEIADGIMMWYRDRKWADRTFNMRALGNMMKRWKKPSKEWRRRGRKMREKANRKELIDFLKAAGHDGIEYENDAEDVGSTSYINFDPVVAEDLYHATTHDIDEFKPLSHFGTPEAAAIRADAISGGIAGGYRGDHTAPRTYRANMPLNNPIKMDDDGGNHDYAVQIANSIRHYYKRNRDEPLAFELHELKSMTNRWSDEGPKRNDEKQRKELIHFLKSYGYDGIEYTNEVEDTGSASYMNLDPVMAESAAESTIYDDGKVRATIEPWEEGVVIRELSSYNSADAGQAVKHLKQEYGHVTVFNIGERDTESYTFWMRALKRGLLDDAYLPNGERATPYSTQAGVTINYNGQPKVGVMPQRSMNDSTLMMIPTAAMDDAFKRDGSDFYVGPGGSGAAIGKRYEQFQQWIDKYDQYDLPEVGVRDNGRLGFTNGRHRYAVFRDAGVDPMPVAMGNSDIENAKKLGGVIRESMITEMADPQMIRDAAPKVLARLKKQMVGDARSSESRVRIAFQKDTGMEMDDPKWDEKFAIWKEGYAQRIVGKAIGELNKGMEFRDGKLLVYRTIDAGESFLDDEWGGTFSSRGLGQYWSWDKEAAYPWRGGGLGNDWLIIGAVDPARVNWEEILYANAHPSLAHEKEINISEGTPIKILGIEKDGESVDPSLYGGRGRVLMASMGEGMSVQMSSDEMIEYLRQHHDANLHQDYIDHINSFDSFVLRDIPIASIAKTELAGLEQAKVAQYKGMDFSKAPPIVMGGGHILDGYHRVSVAKALGIPSIKGYVGMES